MYFLNVNLFRVHPTNMTAIFFGERSPRRVFRELWPIGQLLGRLGRKERSMGIGACITA